jgi:hypothetical protein
MKAYNDERAKAIRDKATIVVRGTVPNYHVDNLDTNTIIAAGFVTPASAERYAHTIRNQQAQVAGHKPVD